MDLTVQPTPYEPSLDANNNYVDKVPAPFVLANGVRCACSPRGTLFTTKINMTSHFKTLCHQSWIETQNRNKQNHLTELMELRELVKQQTILIAERDQKIVRFEREVREKEMAIRALSSILHSRSSSCMGLQDEEVNLLDIDM
jgi:hypothetical protein